MNVGDKVEHKFTFQAGLVTSVTPDHAAVKVAWDRNDLTDSKCLREFVTSTDFRLIDSGDLTKWANGPNT